MNVSYKEMLKKFEYSYYDERVKNNVLQFFFFPGKIAEQARRK
jgi:hypothetical protein